MPIPPGVVGLEIARAPSAEAAPGLIGSSTITAPERTRPVLAHAFTNQSAKFLPILLSDTGRIMRFGIFCWILQPVRTDRKFGQGLLTRPSSATA